MSKLIKPQGYSSLTEEEMKLLVEKNNELEIIIESSYDGICLVDSSGKCLRVNTAYEILCGVPKEKLVGRHMQELIDAGYFNVSCALKVLEKRKPLTVVTTLRTGKSVLVTGTPIINKNEVWRVVVNVRDITELINLKKEFEETKKITEIYQAELEQLREEQEQLADFITKSNEMKYVFGQAKKVGKADCTVLILGETGVGKGVLARAIHKCSTRKGGPFIAVNCGAIPEALLESELFGYAKGSFTGAKTEGKVGLFELANKGTLFLDEIGEIPLNLQVKLLHAIEERRIRRVGGTNFIDLDVRIVAATNRDLKEMVARGSFREDLYYRLNVVNILIPPLRERKDDILALSLYFLNKFNDKYNVNVKITPEVVDCFNSYEWPGNVRELENVMESLVVMNEGEKILLDSLPYHIKKSSSQAEIKLALAKNLPLKKAIEQVEKIFLEKAFEEYQTTREIARILEIDQATVVRKAKKYSLGKKIKDMLID